jgi:nucleoside phosphorylase
VPIPVDVVIITALEEEREAVLRKLPGRRRVTPTRDDIQIYYSARLPVKIPNKPDSAYRIVVMSLVNMGRVPAATATTDAIRRWKPEYVLLVGIAGGVGEAGVQLGDVLIADQIADYEQAKVRPNTSQIRWETHRSNARLLNAARHLKVRDWQALITTPRPTKGAPKRHIGPIATGDKVIAAEQVLRTLQKTWPKLIGVEMEAGGAATASFNSPTAPGFFMVRGVSDLADEKKGSASVDKWRTYACDVAAAYAIALLRTGPFLPKDQGPKVARVAVPAGASSRKRTDPPASPGRVQRGIPVPPQVRSFTERDKDLFLAQSIKDIKAYFQRARLKLNRSPEEVSVDLTTISPRKFVATAYLNGEKVNQCKVWLGDTHYAGSLCYVDGRYITIDHDNTINSSFSVQSAENTLYLSTHSMFFSGLMPRSKGHLTAREAAEQLWERFCLPLKDGGSMVRW